MGSRSINGASCYTHSSHESPRPVRCPWLLTCRRNRSSFVESLCRRSVRHEYFCSIEHHALLYKFIVENVANENGKSWKRHQERTECLDESHHGEFGVAGQGRISRRHLLGTAGDRDNRRHRLGPHTAQRFPGVVAIRSR